MLMGASEMELERETGRDAGREPTMAASVEMRRWGERVLGASEDEEREVGRV